MHLGQLLAYTGRYVESISWFAKGRELNPFPPKWYDVFVGIGAYIGEHYQETEKLLSNPTDYVLDLMYLAAALGQLGRIAEARAILDQCARLKPDIPIIKFAEAEPYQNPADTEHLIDGLRKAGLGV